MIVAYISDLHLEFRKRFGFDSLTGMDVRQYESIVFPDFLDADVLILAGDIHPDEEVRHHLKTELEKRYQIPVIMVKGNHDYWYSDFEDDGVTITEVLGFTIASTTLWTRINPPYVFMAKKFSDFQNINGITLDNHQAAHRIALDGLLAAKPDIVVTHHAPSYQSVSAEFQGNAWNPFFVSNLDPFVEALKAKVWIHGHVHSKWDYMIGDTRVLCNPVGYPGEIKERVDIQYFVL